MEEAAVHAVDGLAGMPELIFVLGILCIISLLLIKTVPMYRDFKVKKLESENTFRQKQLDIERDRELRKMAEMKQRSERDKESAVLMQASVAAQERSTIAINESTAQMAAMMAKLDVSQQGSASMRETVDDIAVEVHDIHNAVLG